VIEKVDLVANFVNLNAEIISYNYSKDVDSILNSAPIQHKCNC